MASANGLTLSAATDDQYLESLKRQVKDWGGGYSEEEFIGREFALKATEFGKAQRCWVLTPSDQIGTIDFFCSCETYRRPVLYTTPTTPTSSATSPLQPQLGLSYGIGSVFTVPRHRKKGYAKSMMKLLHVAIGLPSDMELPRVTVDVGPEWKGGKDAVLSFLYSDVGTFYESCGPPGWHILAPLQTSWILGELKDGWEEVLKGAATVEPITEDDFPALVQIDSDLLSSEVQSLSTSFSTTTPAFILPPTTANYLWSNIRTKYYAKVKKLSSTKHWGARVGELGSGQESFITWTTDGPNSILNVNRLRVARPEDGARLLLEAIRAAKEAGVKRVDAWSLDEKVLRSLPEGLRGDSHTRTEHLSAVAIYGKGWGGAEAKDFRWGLNEHFSWL